MACLVDVVLKLGFMTTANNLVSTQQGILQKLVAGAIVLMTSSISHPCFSSSIERSWPTIAL